MADLAILANVIGIGIKSGRVVLKGFIYDFNFWIVPSLVLSMLRSNFVLYYVEWLSSPQKILASDEWV